MEKQKQEQAAQGPAAANSRPRRRSSPGNPRLLAQSGAPAQPPGQGGAPTAGQQMSREAAIAASPRIKIDTPRLTGSIALKGGRIDDLALTQYRETIDPTSPTDRAAVTVRQPPVRSMPSSAGRRDGRQRQAAGQRHGVDAGGLRPAYGRPAGHADLGQRRRRHLQPHHRVDDKYLFTVTDEAANKGAPPVTLYPYALVSRHGTPRNARLLRPA